MPTYPLGTPVIIELSGRYILHHDRKRNRVKAERVGASAAGLYDGDDAEQVPKLNPKTGTPLADNGGV